LSRTQKYEGGVRVGYGGKYGKSRRVYRNLYLDVYKYRPHKPYVVTGKH